MRFIKSPMSIAIAPQIFPYDWSSEIFKISNFFIKIINFSTNNVARATISTFVYRNKLKKLCCMVSLINLYIKS